MARRRLLAGSEALTSGGAAAWTEIGSRNLAGRMRSSCISPDGTKLYAGSSLGGLWRGDLDGTNWEPLGDNHYGGVDEVVALEGAAAGAADVLIVRAGDDLARSADDGASWGPVVGLPASLDVRDMVLLGDAAQTVLVYGTAGNQSQLYDSHDLGQSFQLRWALSPAWAGGIWVPRVGASAGTDVYMLHQRKLLRSTSGGSGFVELSTVAGSGNAGRLTGSESGGPTLYVTLRQGGAWNIFRSTDGGSSFTQRSSNLGDYWDTSFCASITDPNKVLYGGVECWRSANGGSSFIKVNSWGSYYGNPQARLHADIFGIDCWPDPDAPQTGERWIISCDGGTYESRTSMSSVNNLSMSGLGVSQYYSTLTASDNPDRVMAGSQDQGYQRGTVQTSSGPGPSTNFTQVISGDYGHLCSSDGTHNWVFSTYPGFVLIQPSFGSNSLGTVDFPSGANHLWLPPVVADPTQSTAFYFLGSRLYRYQLSGGGWSNVQHSSQAFDAGGSQYLTAMAIAPSNSSQMYACDSAGRMWRSTNGGVDWTQSSSSMPGEHYFYGNALVVHPTNRQEAFIGGSGYSTAGVRKTMDGGSTWTSAGTGLPSTLTYGLAYAADGSGDVYAATEAGAYRWDRSAETWENVMGLEAPITLYWSVEAVAADNLMRFGTYGRGIWDYSLDEPQPPGPGLAYCVGDGTGPCPCGNHNDGSLNGGEAGCANGVSLGGAALLASGSNSVFAGDLMLQALGLDPNQPGLYFQGDNQVAGGLGVGFGDGLRCAGGKVVRLQVVAADVFGDSNTSVDVAAAGGVSVGEVKRYQLWYRNPQTTTCLSGFNLTNGYEIVWQP